TRCRAAPRRSRSWSSGRRSPTHPARPSSSSTSICSTWTRPQSSSGSRCWRACAPSPCWSSARRSGRRTPPPRAPPAPGSSRRSRRACGRCATPSSHSTRSTFMATKILLIEDNPDTARLMVRALEAAAQSFEVASVFSARDGLGHLAAQPVDCVLLDYRLPDADGLGCLRKIRDQHPDVPVVVVTGAGSEEVAVEAMKLGATDYVVKHGKYLVTVPVVVREALGRRELERTAARYRSALRSTRREVTRLQHELRERYRMDGIIGQSPAIENA